MAANRVILTAGEAIKREARLMSGTTRAGLFVMPAANPGWTEADKSTGAVAPATAGYRDQIAITDLSSLNALSWDDVANPGDQIAILYPTNGCIVNVLLDASASGTIAKGSKVAIGAGGGIVAGGDSDFIGVANETIVVAEANPRRIKVEVLK